MIFTLLFISLIILCSFLIFIPFLTRKTENFGVSIPESMFDREIFQNMRKRYALLTSLLSIILLLVTATLYFFLNMDENTFAIVYTVIIFSFLITSFFIYLHFHRQMRELKQKEKWQKNKVQKTVIYTKFREQRLTISNWWYLIPLLITLSTGFLTILFYDKLPDEIPMNYNLAGEVTRWTEKSLGSVLILPAIQLFLVVVFIFINIVIQRAKQQISSTNYESSLQQNIIFRRRWSIFLFIMLSALIFLFSLLTIGSYFSAIPNIVLTISPFIVTIAILISTLILAVTTGQSGSRVHSNKAKTDYIIGRDDDEYWKLGQFYVNKNDPAIFIEKRFGIGWTINFARPLGWIFLIGMILLPIILVYLLTKF